MVSVDLPPLTVPHRVSLVEAGLLPTKAASPIELGTIIELVSPKQQPVLIMGDLNACTAALGPTVEGQPLLYEH